MKIILLLLIASTGFAQLNIDAKFLKDHKPEYYKPIKQRAVSMWENQHSLIVSEINVQASALFDMDVIIKSDSLDSDLFLSIAEKYCDTITGNHLYTNTCDWNLIHIEYIEESKLKKRVLMKILNLYACLGGNRYKWNEVKEDIEVTAVELDPEAARLYQERFPNDKVIVTDAHQYLLDHYKEFDFIWSSPPCPTHSRARFWNAVNIDTNTKPKYPDMKLYEEIIFLDNWFDGGYVVENVVPYYGPFMSPKKRGRHLFWTNFNIPIELSKRTIQMGGKNEVGRLSRFHDFKFSKYKGEQRTDKIARNLVDYEAGRTILETYLGIQRSKNINQTELFS